MREQRQMDENIYKLYWEDVDERLIYAEQDDRSWLLAEEVFGYEKKNSLYIYHQGKLSAFYSHEDIKEESARGYEFYLRSENISRVIEIKREAKKKMDLFLDDGNRIQVDTLSDSDLESLIMKTLEHQLIALRAHFLDQPQFFERFESEGDSSHVERFKDLARARYEYSRKAWSNGLGFNHTLFQEYGRRRGLSLAESESLTWEELANDSYDRGLLSDRSMKYAIHSDRHVHKISTGNEVDVLISTFENFENEKEVKGVVGNKGYVRAKAFVLKNEYLDLKKLPEGMEKGMVLIVQNAWPELSKYYRFASAIVANEGGITSHGVVVAREYKIPCVVGTRTGTKVFNTGDVVEVDAINGFVRRI